MKIAIILSSIRDNRLADRVFSKVKTLIGTSFDYTIVDPREFQLPLLNKRFYEMKEPEDVFKKLHTIFDASEGFLIISAEYNHSIPPALSNMLDHFGPEFGYKSCGIITYSDGPIGGARSGEQLKLMCSTLGMCPIPISPAWGLAHKAGTPEGKSFEDNFERNFSKFIKQFMWYTEALSSKRSEG
jgi:NAD(P)H-dependent FMN reductase